MHIDSKVIGKKVKLDCQIDALKKERDRYKKALGIIAGNEPGECRHRNEMCSCDMELAQEALAPAPDVGEKL